MEIDMVASGRIIIESNGTAKLIKTVKEDKALNILASQIAGVVQSPYEDKIVVVYKRERRGYEGPPNVSLFTLVGCDLKKTFK